MAVTFTVDIESLAPVSWTSFPTTRTWDMLFPMERAQLKKDVIEGLNALGYDRVLKGACAFDDPDPNGWRGCFVARAYGAREEFRAKMYDMLGDYPVERIMNVANHKLDSIVCMFDNYKPQLKEIVTEWLLDPVNQNRLPEPRPGRKVSRQWTFLDEAPTKTPTKTSTPAAPSPSVTAAPVQSSTTDTDSESPYLTESPYRSSSPQIVPFT